MRSGSLFTTTLVQGPVFVSPTGDAEADMKERPVLETLSLPQLGSSVKGDNSAAHPAGSPEMGLTQCVLCEEVYNTASPEDRRVCLEHLLTAHSLVIGEVEMIADLKGYFRYWKERLKEEPLTNFCTAFDMGQKVGSESLSGNSPGETRYYLLCDVLPEDKDLRQFLQQQKLTRVLERQQEERHEEASPRGCLFCRQQFSGRRSTIINHMAGDHSFNIGQPDNLVYVEEFLDLLQTKLNNLQCLYCEKTFKDRLTLKEHMRKKQHKRINPKNRAYDRFYIINYLELGKNWELIQSEDDTDIEDSGEGDTDTEGEWSEWQEDPGAQALCLYCPFSSSSSEKLQSHMKELHEFDLEGVRRERGLTFYQQVKLINYIRRQIHQGMCYGCSTQFPDKQDLLDHMHSANHIILLPQETSWDQPQYFFPTYENDNLLCQLEDGEEVEDESAASSGVCLPEDTPVIPEDVVSVESLLLKQPLG